MPTIHLIDGEKGGVGKSFVTRAMIQYGLDRNLPFVAVETDRSNPDVAAVYKDLCKFAIFSEDEKQADDTDRLFEIAIDRPVIGSLPSQVHLAMKAWIERNQLLKLRDESVLKFCKWLVGNGEYDSVNLFISSLNCYENQMNPISSQKLWAR